MASHWIASVLCVLSLITVSYCTSLRWEELNIRSLPLRRRWFAGSAIAGGNLFVFGGEGNKIGINDTGILGDTYRLSLTLDSVLSWIEIPQATAPMPRYGFVGGVIGDYWIISHGCDSDICFSDTWAMNLLENPPQWSQLIDSNSNTSGPLSVPEARFSVAGGIYPGSDELWLSMGETKSGLKLSDTWILQINITEDGILGTWLEVSAGSGLNQYFPFLPSARSLHSGTPINASTFAIFGGCASGGQVGGPCPLQDNWVLDLDSSQWEAFPTCATPAVRSSMIAVPNHPGQAFIIGGSRNYAPGIFPQLIVPLNTSGGGEVYIMNTEGTGENISDWKRVLVGGSFPSHREGASVAVDGDDVYMIGGREIENLLFQSDVWVLRGDGETDSDANCPSPQFTYVHLHGLLMYIAWGLLLPLGVLLGRYYRWTWPCWFILHIICQSLGVLLTVAAFVIIFLVGSYSAPDFPHAIIGIILTFLLIQQFLSGIFHPCVDKENGKTPTKEKSAYRKCWEVYHGASGFISISIGFGQVMLGVLLIGAPIVVWSLWAGLGGLWIITFIMHEFVYICYKLVHKVRQKNIY